jgi:hypothetical protein
MSDANLAGITSKPSSYNPIRDRERQKVRMRLERAKNKAGFNHITVKAWLLITANKASSDE